jgi:hypothetical protein
VAQQICSKWFSKKCLYSLDAFSWNMIVCHWLFKSWGAGATKCLME